MSVRVGVMGVMLMPHALSYIRECCCSGLVGSSNTMFMVWVSMMLLMMCAPLRALVGYLCVDGRVVGISFASPGIMCRLLCAEGCVGVTIDGCSGCVVIGIHCCSGCVVIGNCVCCFVLFVVLFLLIDALLKKFEIVSKTVM